MSAIIEDAIRHVDPHEHKPNHVPQSVPNDQINRRRMLALTASSALLGTVGCSEKSEPATESSAPRRDVPLRVALFGSASDRDEIARGWATVSEQKLKFDLISPNRTATEGGGLNALAKKNDVLIHPVSAVADLTAGESIVPFSADEFQSFEENMGQLYPALRNGAATYATQMVAIPLGASLPALLASDQVDPFSDWKEYDQWVQDLKGAVAEPLANGWAGTAFLWRASSTIETGWLFSREDLSPLINTKPYVDVLQFMKQSADRYKSETRLTPSDIWSELLSGALVGAIGMRMTAEEVQLTATNLPGVAGENRVLLDPFSLVASISSACRQTSASKEFANWLSGGDGVENTRRQVSGMSRTRTQAIDSTQSEQQQSDAYETWLRNRLQTPVTLPAMQLLSAHKYYNVLDQRIGDCLDGKSSPKETLDSIAQAWMLITDEVGLEKQQRAWRRAQGMRA